MKCWNTGKESRISGLDRLRLCAWRAMAELMMGGPAAAWAQGTTPAPASTDLPTVSTTPVPNPAGPADVPAATDAPAVNAAPPASPVVPAESPLGPTDLTPWGMYLNADPIVKSVLIGLVLASVVTWTIWLAKTMEILSARRRVRAGLEVLSRVRTSAEAAERLGDRKSEVRRFVDAAAIEMNLSADVVETDGIKERVASRLERLEAGCRPARSSAAPACWRPSARPRRSSACSARSGAS